MINVAIIGLGYWGPNFAKVVSESSSANLSWFCDTSSKNLAKLKTNYKSVPSTQNLDEVLDDKSVDAVIITTPASLHYEITRKALLSGKDVLVEKPLALTKIEAMDLIKLSKKNKRILLVDHIYLFNNSIQKIKELIKKDELGKIYYGHADYTALGPVRVDVSAVADLAIHFLYTIIYFLNETPTSISAYGKEFLPPKFVDVAFLNLEFASGTVFNLRVSWIDPVKTRSLVLVGDKKMITFDDTKNDKITIYDRAIKRNRSTSPKFDPVKYPYTFRYGDITIPHIVNTEPLTSVFENFITSVKTRKAPLVNGVDAVNLVTLLETAEHSLKNGGRKICIRINKKTKILYAYR